MCIYIYMYTYMYKHYTCVSMNVCIYTNIYRNASPECDGDERPFLKVRLFQCMNLGSSPAYLPFAFCWMIIKWPTKFKFEVEDSFTNITYVRDTGITIAEIIGSHCERGLYRCGTIGDLAMFPNHYHQCHEWALVFLEFSGADLDRKGSWDG